MDSLSTLAATNYPDRAVRSTSEIHAEVEWLCDQAATHIVAAAPDAAAADELRARAIGVLWASGIHPTHAEAWADLTIERILLDH